VIAGGKLRLFYVLGRVVNCVLLGGHRTVKCHEQPWEEIQLGTKVKEIA
jgi:hypothetical protein